jgi:hypothetical protein
MVLDPQRQITSPRASFQAVDQLKVHINDFIASYNANARPSSGPRAKSIKSRSSHALRSSESGY